MYNPLRICLLMFLLTLLSGAQSTPSAKKQNSKTPSQSKNEKQKSTSNSNTETFKVTSPVRILHEELGADFTKEPYTHGVIDYKSTAAGELDVNALFNALKITRDNDATLHRVTIIHIIRWNDSDHTGVDFQKWYVYDPYLPNYNSYLTSRKSLFEGQNISGRKNYRSIYIHLNKQFVEPTFDSTTHQANYEDESIKATCLPDANGILPITRDANGNPLPPPTDCLKHAVSYTIAITKQQSQFMQDLKTVLSIVSPAAAVGGAERITPPKVTGYWSMSEFTSQYDDSSLTITPSMNSTQPTQGNVASPSGQDTASKQLSPTTYTNQKPSYVGLSFAVPVTSYKSVTYNSSNGTLAPTSITQQNIYVNFDLYLPRAQPGLMTLRWIPHPFAGLPIKGKVLQHTMAGVAFGLPWFEPFGGIVFDRQNGSINGASQRTTFKGVFGFKVSVSAVAKALKK
jgi:hypothetical protein